MLAFGKMHSALFDLMRGDHARATPKTFELANLAREHELAMYDAFGAFLHGWTTTKSGALAAGLENMRRGVVLLREQNILLFDGLLKIALAEAEVRAGDLDRALAALDEGLATADRMGFRAFEAELHRARGDILSQRDPTNSAPAEGSFLTAIAVAKQQGTRSFELRAVLALAKLYQSTGRLTEAHAVLAPGLEGFAPTREMPEIAEAQALLGALTETGEVKNATASRQRRLQLQTSYSRAVMWSRGYGAEETQAAFARAQELAAGVDNSAERFDAYYGQWAGRLQRGELRSARETAEKFLREAEKEAPTTEAAAARRCLGVACLWQGDLAVARAHFEQALGTLDPERDREAKFRFGMDVGVSATVFLALTNWLLGEAGPARKLIEEAIARAVESAHSPTLANVYWFKALFDAFRDDAEAGRRAADSLLEVGRRHSLGLFLAFGALSSGWAHARLGDRVTGMAELRQALAAYAEQGNKLYAPFFQGLLAEREAEDPSDVVPLARIDEALALAEQTGQRWTDALLHRIRGDVLLKADPENAARAEEAYLAAIGVAREQGARSFGLRAALSLAELYQASGRPADAYAALAPALEGFSPTPEMPEIAEAQALVATLANADEVKAAQAQRQRRLKLQTSYGQAMMLSRGFASEESSVAFTRARELFDQLGNAEERFDTYYGLFISQLLRGEIGSARETAEAFRHEAESAGRLTEAAVAHRNLGMACLYEGALDDARTYFSEALRIYDPERDRDARFRFGADTGAAAAAYFAQTNWYLGEISGAIELIEEAVRRAVESGHVPTIALIYHLKGMFDIQCGDAAAALGVSEPLVELTREHSMTLYHAHGSVHAAWAHTRLSDDDLLVTKLAQAVSAFAEHGAKLYLPFYQGLLAELECERQSADLALTRIDDALALSEQTRQHWIYPFLQRVRGGILLKRHAADPAPAEDAFRSAVAVAKQQGARSLGLRAALALARLYQSTGRLAEAHAVLPPALEGFAPTSQMREIAQAQAALAELSQTAEVKAEAAQRRRLTKLRVAYGNALFAARGFGAPETTRSLRQSPRVGVWRQGRA